MTSFATAGEVADAARAALPPEVWDYLSGGGGTEITLRRNRAALDNLLLRPRVLRDVSRCDPSTTFLGIPLALPVMLAPIGTLGLFPPEGAAACARAAQAAVTAAFVGILSVPSLEELTDAVRSVIGYGADGPLAVVRDRLIVGRAMGRVPKDVPIAMTSV